MTEKEKEYALKVEKLINTNDKIIDKLIQKNDWYYADTVLEDMKQSLTECYYPQDINKADDILKAIWRLNKASKEQMVRFVILTKDFFEVVSNETVCNMYDTAVKQKQKTKKKSR